MTKEVTNKATKGGGLANFKGKRHELTKKDASKGGKNMTVYRKFVLGINRRKYCKPECPLYPCILEPLSRIKYKDKKGKPQCALKKQPPEIVRRFYAYVIDGSEKEFISEMVSSLFKISVRPSPDYSELIKMGEKVHKMKFGDKSRIDANIDVIKVIWGKKKGAKKK